MVRPVLYYVRHGLTDWNIEGRLQGGNDIPLNDRGRAQAAQCADILRDLFARDGRAATDFHYVSSPLVRASETMDILRKALGLPPDGYAREPRLKEIAFGDWEGLTYLGRVEARQVGGGPARRRQVAVPSARRRDL